MTNYVVRVKAFSEFLVTNAESEEHAFDLVSDEISLSPFEIDEMYIDQTLDEGDDDLEHYKDLVDQVI